MEEKEKLFLRLTILRSKKDDPHAQEVLISLYFDDLFKEVHKSLYPLIFLKTGQFDGSRAELTQSNQNALDLLEKSLKKLKLYIQNNEHDLERIIHKIEKKQNEIIEEKDMKGAARGILNKFETLSNLNIQLKSTDFSNLLKNLDPEKELELIDAVTNLLILKHQEIKNVKNRFFS